jgi:hypothetical protein
MKEVYNSFHSRRWNFKCCWHIRHKALVFTATWFEAYVQKHRCSSSTQWPTLKTGLTCKSEELHTFCGNHRKCQQLTSIDSFWNCMAMMWCPDNRLPNGAMSAFGTDNVTVNNRSWWWSSSMTEVKTACVKELFQKKRYVMLSCMASDLG